MDRNDTLSRRFFLQPACPRQRQYEALRAVFVDGLPQKAAAARFRYSQGAFRGLVRQFRRACAAGAPPPFSSARAADDRQRCRPPLPPRGRTRRRPPTSGR